MRQITILACAFAVASCTPSYIYRPAANATATIKGRVAADYPIPPTVPQGDLRLASFGMSEISPSTAASAKQMAVHLRMVVADNSPAPWTLDARQQIVALPDGQRLAPALVTTREGQAGLPLVTVPAGGKRVIDLFYALPPSIQSASTVGQFDVVWDIDTPQQRVTERTPFDRLRDPPSGAYGYEFEWGGWGGPFWSDAIYPGYHGDVFIGEPRWGGWGGGPEGHGEGARGGDVGAHGEGGGHGEHGAGGRR